MNIEEQIHVIPGGDSKPHIQTMNCVCKPLVQTGNQNGIFVRPIVIHNPFDGRERDPNYQKAAQMGIENMANQFAFEDGEGPIPPLP